MINNLTDWCRIKATVRLSDTNTSMCNGVQEPNNCSILQNNSKRRMVNTRRNQKYKLQQTFEFFSFDFILSKYFVRNLRYVLYTSVSYIQKIKNFFFLIRLLYFFRTLGIMALINLLYAVTLKNFLFLFLFFFTLLTLPLFSSPTTHTISSGR